MNILLLGGTRDALSIGEALIAAGHTLIYSIAGVAGKPDIQCEWRVGGFGGCEGLTGELRERRIDLLIDATHPYAATISSHAAQASGAAGVPLYRYTRPAWQPQSSDNWQMVANEWSAVASAIARFRRPFFTIGNAPLSHTADIQSGQQWLVRSLSMSAPEDSRIRLISARGPFRVNDERALMTLTAVDALVSKNSGGTAVAAKLDVARELGIAVIMLQRPELAPIDTEFSNVEALLEAVEAFDSSS